MEPKQSPLHMKILGIFLAVGGIVMVLAIAGLVGIDRWLRRDSEPALAGLRKDVTDNLDFFCEQQAVLAADPWFHEPRTEGDAGLLLNTWVTWDGGAVPKRSPLAIPSHLPQRNADFNDWQASQVDVSSLDFHWMAQLHAYDRWDLLQNTPVKQPTPISMITARYLDFLQLRLWARFRLLQGLRSGRPLDAARDVRHLAWLIYRTDMLLGAMIAASLLDLEREAHDSLPSPPPEWRPMSREQVARMRAVLMSSFVFSNVLMPVEVAKKSRRCSDPVARCVAMTETAFSAKLLEPLARGGYREAYAAFEADLASLPCPTSAGRTIWEHGATFEDDSYKGFVEPYDLLRRLPRAHFGPRIAERVLTSNITTLDRLRSFSDQLASGDFEPKP